MLVTILVIIIVLAVVGAFPVHNRYGAGGSFGWVGGVVLLLIILYLLGVVH